MRHSLTALVLVLALTVSMTGEAKKKKSRPRPRAQHAAMGFSVPMTGGVCNREFRSCASKCKGELATGCFGSCEVTCHACEYQTNGRFDGRGSCKK